MTWRCICGEELSDAQEFHVHAEGTMTGTIEFGCCFCGDSIDPPQVPKGVMLQWGDEDNEWQQWFCHLECFIEALDPHAREFGFAWDSNEEI